MTWTERVLDIDLVSATFFGSFNGGQTFADIEPIDALFENGISQWNIDGGFDRGDNLISDTSGPSGYNFIMTEYVYDAEFDVIPAAANRFNVVAKIEGGGISAWADALRHGISRALLVADPSLRPTLKKAGLLTRDSREKESKKYGLKRARKAQQYTKR